MRTKNGKRIAVLGAGGIGGSITGYLAHAGLDVTVIDTWPEHVMAIKANGLQVEDVQHGFTVPVTALHIGEVSGVPAPFDIVVLSFKSYDTVWATHLIAPHLAETGFVLPAQNGINDDTVAGVVGQQRTVGFVPQMSGAVYEPGHIVRTDPMNYPPFLIGELDGTVTARVREALELFKAVTPGGELVEDIVAARWTKFRFNCMVNALAGILGDKPGPINDKQKALTTMIKILTGAEVFCVAQTLGIAMKPFKGIRGLTNEDLQNLHTRADLERLRDKVLGAAKPAPAKKKAKKPAKPANKLSARGRASFLQDVIKGRKVEIDALNGYAVKKGREAGVPTPMNETICALVGRLERGETAPGLHNLEELGRALPQA